MVVDGKCEERPARDRNDPEPVLDISFGFEFADFDLPVAFPFDDVDYRERHYVPHITFG